MTLTDFILETCGDLGKFKKVSPAIVKQLGYQFSERKLLISRESNNRPLFYIHELQDQDDPRRQLDFCYLLKVDADIGIVLAHRFDRYLGFGS